MSLWERTPERRRATAWPAVATPAAAAADEEGGLRPGTLYRGVSGVDRGPAPMPAQQFDGLRDPMAETFFRRNTWPMTLEEVLDGLTRAGELPAQSVYLIGEAGQIPPHEAPRLRRDFRFAITRAAPGKEPGLLVSSDPGSVFLQVAAWDPVAEVFNYYMRITPAWVWTGGSWSAPAPGSRGKGCFDSHVNGSVVMKELKQPWSKWRSMSATIQLAPDDPLRDNPLHRQVIGAERLELTVKGARQKADITLSDPVGIYFDDLATDGWSTPDGSDPKSFWTFERGDTDFPVRAAYEVPGDPGFTVGDITIGGRPVEFGAQIADVVTVKLTATACRTGLSTAEPQTACVELAAGDDVTPGAFSPGAFSTHGYLGAHPDQASRRTRLVA